jgi:hypothetical protein
MPKVKQPVRKKQTRAKSKGSNSSPKKAAKPKLTSPEYADYIQRYKQYGEGRPLLSSAEFDRLDDELLDMLALESVRGLNDDQIIRLQELEYLLLDSEQ